MGRHARDIQHEARERDVDTHTGIQIKDGF